MKLVLLSGGSGKRLWPLSNDSRSKQFLRMLKNERTGHLESMVQRVWGQLTSVKMETSTVIATGKDQVEMLHAQLGDDVPLIIEPERRDTFPAIALAATYLYSVQGASLNEVIGVLPVDPFVEISFFEHIKKLEKVLDDTDFDLALLGVNPTFPSEKYGYIVPKTIRENYIEVSHFKEKPDERTAQELIKQHALWNCGVFAFKLGTIIKLLEQKKVPLSYEELRKNYKMLNKTSFDYEVVEKTDAIVALPYDGYWKDLGTWNTLTEEMATQHVGKGTISEDSENTHVVNELEIPIHVLGLSNLIVAASPDGILVSDKQASPRVKELLKDHDLRPMYEERRWGWYRVLDYIKYEEGHEVLTKRIRIKAGRNLSYHYHHERNETWTILEGTGVVAINGELQNVKPGDVLQLKAGARHAIKGVTDLELIEIQSGSQLVEDDITRLLLDWSMIEAQCLPVVK